MSIGGVSTVQRNKISGIEEERERGQGELNYRISIETGQGIEFKVGFFRSVPSNGPLTTDPNRQLFLGKDVILKYLANQRPYGLVN